MEDRLFLVHPNNRLTKVDSLTIPNLEKRRASIQSELKELGKVNVEDAKKKKSELRYIESYLNVMRKVQSICTTCQVDGQDYDYDRENEILDDISNDMALLKQAEKEICQYESESSSSTSSVSNVPRIEGAHSGTV
jgi:hypothetical protein